MLLNNAISLRQAGASDWPAVEALLLANKLPTDGAQTHLPTYLLAVSNGEVVGCAGAEVYGTLALMRSVAVALGVQKQGIGRLLVERLLHEARSRELAQVVARGAAGLAEALGQHAGRERPVGRQLVVDAHPQRVGEALQARRREHVVDAGVGDEPEDVEAGTWAGMLPLRTVAGPLEPDPLTSAPVPDDVARRAEQLADELAAGWGGPTAQ